MILGRLPRQTVIRGVWGFAILDSRFAIGGMHTRNRESFNGKPKASAFAAALTPSACR